ncbi:nucleotide-diphospho-sugar transferase [Phlyctochytrium arcticum]|nr:nucleotide-diphospho-sugar transferase [Phlyctochytrium arcticum]
MPVQLPANVPSATERCAYVTLLTSDSYLPGVLVLAASLRSSLTRIPLICMVPTNALSDYALGAVRQAFDRVVDVSMFRSESHANLQLLGRSDLDITYTKLHAFNPEVTQCDRVVYMDADVMITRSVDELFSYLDGDVVFAAASDIGWPDCFNSGVMALRPRQDIFDQLVRMATTDGSFDGGDQGLLNQYFSSWSSGIARPGSSFHRTARIPFTFNVTPTSFYSYLPALEHFKDSISAVHFIGATKPWQQARPTGGRGGATESTLQNAAMQSFLARWWQLFDLVAHIIRGNGGKNTTATQHQQNNILHKANNHSAPQAAPPQQHNYGTTQHHAPRSDPTTEFSNYRVAWNEREAVPVRRSFPSASGGKSNFSPFHSPADPKFASNSPEMASSLYPDANVSDQGKGEPDIESKTFGHSGSVSENSYTPPPAKVTAVRRASSYKEFEMENSRAPTHHPDPEQDLGNYRVGWNEQELGVRARMRETPQATSPNMEDTHWHSSSTQLINTSGAPSPFDLATHMQHNASRPVSAHISPAISGHATDADSEEEDEDDRVWQQDGEAPDPEEFLAKLRRPRSASGGSQKNMRGQIPNVKRGTAVNAGLPDGAIAPAYDQGT